MQVIFSLTPEERAAVQEIANKHYKRNRSAAARKAFALLAAHHEMEFEERASDDASELEKMRRESIERGKERRKQAELEFYHKHGFWPPSAPAGKTQDEPTQEEGEELEVSVAPEDIKEAFHESVESYKVLHDPSMVGLVAKQSGFEDVETMFSSISSYLESHLQYLDLREKTAQAIEFINRVKQEWRTYFYSKAK